MDLKIIDHLSIFYVSVHILYYLISMNVQSSFSLFLPIRSCYHKQTECNNVSAAPPAAITLKFVPKTSTVNRNKYVSCTCDVIECKKLRLQLVMTIFVITTEQDMASRITIIQRKFSIEFYLFDNEQFFKFLIYIRTQLKIRLAWSHKWTSFEDDWINRCKLCLVIFHQML